MLALAWLVCGGAALAQGATDAGDGGATPDTSAQSETATIEAAAPVDDIASSENLLKGSIAEFGRNSLQTAEAYIGLGDAQREANDHEKAAESYLAAVEVYRAVDGPFTPLAIGPLTSLGDNYHEAHDDTQAVSAYSEARVVSRRVYGLHNVEQIDRLDRMSESLLDLNQLTEAEAQQIEALRLVQRANPPASDAVLEAIYKYAEWLGERGMYQLQRDQYLRVQRIIRQAYGDEDVRQVRALLGIGNTFRQERNPAGPGISALQDALALLRAQPEGDALAIATALRDIGDWNTSFGKSGYDGVEYQRSWELLGAVAGGERLRKEWYAGANYVLYEPISQRGVSTDKDALPGHVLVRFDIDTAGNPNNVTLIESSPVGFKDEAVLRHIRRSRFRPWVADGATVTGQGLAIRVDFRYLPEAVTSESNSETRN
jgi:TonB family protein